MSKSLSPNRGQALISIAVALVGGGCEKRSGEAIVRGKEHIPIAEVVPSPSAIPADTPAQEDTPSTDEPTPGEATVAEEKNNPGPDVRGTSKDSRAVDHEQWIVDVEMVRDLRRIEVQVEEPRWRTLKVGDRVKVTYKIGKYTNTVWDSALE